MQMRKNAGFTIVELLIVIVVIGILAAVIIVAYNGITARAITARTVQTVSSYNEAIQMYRSVNGSYPPLSPGAGGACLGTGYADRNNDGVGDCGELNYPLKVDPVFDTAMATVISSMPVVNDAPIQMPYQASGDMWVGASFHYYPPNPSDPNGQTNQGFTVNGTSNPYYIMYVVGGGSVNCDLPNLVIPDSAQYGWPKMTTTIPNGQSWSWTDGKTTACVGALPN